MASSASRISAIARGYAEPGEVSYAIEVTDGNRGRLRSGWWSAVRGRGCVPLAGAPPGTGYRVVQVTARLEGSRRGPPVAAATAARVHLRWRPHEQRFVVVGLEREPEIAAETDRELPRQLLAGPRLVSRLVFWPIVRVSDVFEYHHVGGRMTAIFTSDDGRVGVRPELYYATGFRPTGGARFFYRRLPGASELALRLNAGPSALSGELTLRTPAWLGLFGRARWDRRDDWLFAGIGAVDEDELEAEGHGLSRYAATEWLGEVGWSRALIGPVLALLSGDVIHRDYGDQDVSDGDSINQLYGLPPAECAVRGLPPGCVDPALVPGFNQGRRLLRAGAGVTLDLMGEGRHASGLRLSLSSRYAHGIAGDASRHLRLEGDAVVSIGGLDRALLLRLQAGNVEPLGSAPVPFDELMSPSGWDGIRGFPKGRFRGPSGLVGSAEYRWLISFNLDASLFVDAGTVAGERFAELGDARLFPSVGVGLRVHQRVAPHWNAVPDTGAQLAYAPGGGLRLLLTLAAF